MANTVGQFQQAAFTSPAFGDSPIASGVVRGNDNAVATQHNGHDADYTIHVQQSVAGSRPGAGVAGRIWFTSDTFQLAYDTGVAWTSVRVAAASVTPGTFSAGTYTFPGDANVAGNLIVSGNVSGVGTLQIDGPTQLNGNVTFGDATSDTVSFTARLATSVLPSTDSSRSLGSSSLRMGAVWSVEYAMSDGVGNQTFRIGSAGAGLFPVLTPGGDQLVLSYNTSPRFGFYGLGGGSRFSPALDNQGALGDGSFRWNSLRVGTGASQFDGNVTVSNAVLQVTGSGTVTYGGNPYRAAITSPGLNATAYGLAIVDGNSATGGAYLGFVNDGSVLIGSIVRNGATSVQYNTTSDARLKTNIVPTTVDALARVKATPVRSYDWVSGEHVELGFVAQELYDTAPEAVTVGSEDVGAKPWAVDYGRLTPLLMKAVQELAARVEALEAR